ncbi:MAG: hypothetical protein ACYC7E_04895, partial [Armatimonadota bacterium]
MNRQLVSFISRRLVLGCMLGLALGCAQAADIYWTNPAGGNWSTAGNWSAGRAPGSADNAFIILDGTYTVTLTASVTVTSLTLGGISGTQTLANSAYTLTLSGASAINANGVYSQTNGALNGAGTLTVTGIYGWSGGNMRGTGTTNIATGGRLNISGTADKRIYHGSATSGGRKLNNAGTITWAGSGRLLGGDGARITNQTGGVFDVQGDASLDYLFGANPALTNQAGATFRKSGGAGVTTFVRFDFTNSGTLDIQQGTVSFTNNTVSHSFNDGTVIQGSGTVQLGGGDLAMAGAITNNGRFLLSAGRLYVNGTSIATWSGTGAFDWTGGSLRGTGTTSVAAGFHLNLSGTA